MIARTLKAAEKRALWSQSSEDGIEKAHGLKTRDARQRAVRSGGFRFARFDRRIRVAGLIRQRVLPPMSGATVAPIPPMAGRLPGELTVGADGGFR